MTTRSVAPLERRETKPAITRTKRRDQHQHVRISLHSSEAFHGFEDASRDPARHHLAIAPAFEVALHVTGTTEETLRGVPDGVRGRVTTQSSTDGGIHEVSHVYRLDCHCANP